MLPPPPPKRGSTERGEVLLPPPPKKKELSDSTELQEDGNASSGNGASPLQDFSAQELGNWITPRFSGLAQPKDVYQNTPDPVLPKNTKSAEQIEKEIPQQRKELGDLIYPNYKGTPNKDKPTYIWGNKELTREQFVERFEGKDAQVLPGEDFEIIGDDNLKQSVEKIQQKKAQDLIQMQAVSTSSGIPLPLLQASNSTYRGLLNLLESTPKAVAIAAQGIDRVFGTDKDIEDYATYKLGQKAQELTDSAFPVLDQYRDNAALTTVPELLGQTTSFMLGGAVTKSLTLPAKLQAAVKSVPIVGRTLASVELSPGAFVLGGASQAVPEYEAALQETGDPKIALQAFWANMATTGGTEGAVIAKWGNRFDQLTNGSLSDVMSRGFTGTFEGAIEESIQQLATNLTAQQTYDASRQITQGLSESATYGGFVGGVINSFGGVLADKASQLPEGPEKEQLQAVAETYIEKGQDLSTKDVVDINDLAITPEVESLLTQKTELEKDLSKEQPPEVSQILQQQVAQIDQQLVEAQSAGLQQNIESEAANKVADKKEIEVQQLDLSIQDENLSPASKQALEAKKEQLAAEAKELRPQQPNIETKSEDTSKDITSGTEIPSTTTNEPVGDTEAVGQVEEVENNDLGGGVINNVQSEDTYVIDIAELDGMRNQQETDLSSLSATGLEIDIEKNGIKEPLVLVYYPKEGVALLSDGHNRLDVAKGLGATKLPVKIIESFSDAPSKAKPFAKTNATLEAETTIAEPVNLPSTPESNPTDIATSKYGWQAVKTDKGFDLVNSKGRTAATVIVKGDKYSIQHSDGTKILSGNKDVAQGIEKVIRDYFYGKVVQPEKAATLSAPKNPSKTSTPYNAPEGAISTKDGKYYIGEVDGEKTVINSTTGKPADIKTVKKIRQELEDAIDYTIGEQAETNPDGGEEEVLTQIAEGSKNPQEIAQAYIASKFVETAADYTDQIIADNVTGIRSEDFARYGDRRNIDKAINRAWLRKNSLPLDLIAEEISENSGVSISEEDIVDFIQRYPNGLGQFKSERINKLPMELARAFKRETGLTLTDELADKIAGYENKQTIQPGGDNETEAAPAESDGVGNEEPQDKVGAKVRFTDPIGETKIGIVVSEEGDVLKVETTEGGRKYKYTVKPGDATFLSKPTIRFKDNDPSLGLANKLFSFDTGSIKSFLRKWLASEGNLPKEVFDKWIKTNAKINAQLRDIDYTKADLQRAVKEVYGKDLSDVELLQLNEVLAGNEPVANLPAPIQPIAETMRSQIDNLSRRFIAEGIAEGDLVVQIEDNLGTYMTRSYRKFDDPEWAKSVPEDIRNAAKGFIRQENPNLSEDEVDGLINKLLYSPEAPIGVLASAKLGSKDISVLKKREAIPVEIRDLLGEYKDPLVNYARSVTKMVNLLERQKFLNEARDLGLGKFLFEQPNGEHYVAIAAEGSKTMNPLNGLYTTPEIAKAFEEYLKTDPETNPALRAYMKVNAATKYTKTVLNFTGHIRNIISNFGFLTANGNAPLGKFPDAAKSVISDLVKLPDSGYRAKIKEYIELGVLYDNANAGELKAVLKDAIGSDTVEDYIDSRQAKYGRKFLNMVTEAYQAEDNVPKIMQFEAEYAKYREALPEKTDEEIKQIAAENVRLTMPTYSLAPKAIKELRKIPILASFPTFTAEVIRTSYNTVALAKKEMADPATRTIGIKRLAGAMATYTATAALTMLSRYLSGVSDEDDEDLRRFVPEWSKNSQYYYLKGGNGQYAYVDVGYSDPHAYLKKPIIAFMNGEDLGESAKASASEMLKPFFGEGILTSAILDVARNSDENKRAVYNSTSGDLEKIKDISSHIGKTLVPGTITGGDRVYKSITGEISETGKKYDPKTEVTAFMTGQRRTEMDVGQAFGFKVRKFAKDWQEAEQMFNKVYYSRGAVTEEDLKEAQDKAYQARVELFDALYQDYQAGLRLGVSKEILTNQIKGASINGKITKALIDGIMPSSEDLYSKKLSKRDKTLK